MIVVLVKVIIMMMRRKVMKTTKHFWHHCPTIDWLLAFVITLTLSLMHQLNKESKY